MRSIFVGSFDIYNWGLLTKIAVGRWMSSWYKVLESWRVGAGGPLLCGKVGGGWVARR